MTKSSIEKRIEEMEAELRDKKNQEGRGYITIAKENVDMQGNSRTNFVMDSKYMTNTMYNFAYFKSLKKVLPRQQFTQSIQAGAEGRIIAREDVRALRKDVTGHLYGGDRSRKMKLWKKQKKGKKKLKEKAVVRLSSEVFKELLKK